MPRTRLPYLQHQRSRHGKLVWYVRIAHGPRIRINSEYGTQEFMAEYHAAVTGTPIAAPAKSSVADLVNQWDDE